MNKWLSLILAIIWAYSGIAQNAEMADTFRQEGKIYVVIGVIAIVFICVALFLFFIERKLSRLEKEIKEKEAK